MSRTGNINASIERVKDLVVRGRLLMVKDSFTESFRSVGKRHCCSDGIVRYWRRRYEREGLKGLRTRTHPGRPRKISSEAYLKLKRLVRKHDIKQGWRTKRIRELIYKETGMKYSERQVIRITHSWGLSRIKPRPRYVYSKEADRKSFLKKTAG